MAGRPVSFLKTNSLSNCLTAGYYYQDGVVGTLLVGPTLIFPRPPINFRGRTTRKTKSTLLSSCITTFPLMSTLTYFHHATIIQSAIERYTDSVKMKGERGNFLRRQRREAEEEEEEDQEEEEEEEEEEGEGEARKNIKENKGSEEEMLFPREGGDESRY
ncbi:hypothetical protein WN51_04430 [Melipona quadrifasciata]|uniref:Uncharacterized protein n=1 Tax=Melipona quadrifasciata TaxID=166423 RepID=A0A0M8ZS93_9HYME|nr:hypothetical protein WN51_04430 [Melipona quadrifasciata]